MRLSKKKLQTGVAMAALAILFSAAPVFAQQQPVTLTFEGIPDYQPVGSFYGPDYVFSPNTLALVDSDDGGGGNFANEPSPGTIMFFTDGSSAYLNVTNGFQTGFSFFYSSSAAASVRVFDGLNATGNMLGSIDLLAQFSENSCVGDPFGSFCNWSPGGVNFVGTAYSIDFAAVANQAAFDNITFGAAVPQGGGSPSVTNIVGTHSVSDVNQGAVNPVFEGGAILAPLGEGVTQSLTTDLTVRSENGVFSVDDGVTLTASGNIADASGMSGAITKTGTGTLTLTGANSYTGGTLVSAGLLTGNTTSLQGAILNNAAVEFAQTTAGTYAGTMSGTGGLTKTGAGTLTLTGANSYTGGTLVSAGRLTGNTTSLQGVVTNNAAVEFVQASAGTYAGAMSGTGGLTKTGAGTLTLTGANSFTGGTLVSAGRLTGDTTSLQGAIVNNAAVEFAQSASGTYAGAMSGTGGLTKTGAGTLTLAGINSYTGGTLVSAGRLTGNTTSLQGDVTNGAELEFAQGIGGSYTGVVSGTGQLIKTGAGTLTLTGASSYTGGTLVSAGRLAGDASSLQGAIANNAAVEFAQSTAGTYAGTMSGTGSLTKSGTGTLTLTGANSYTGGTLVSAGRITGNTTSMQGAITNNAQVEFAQASAGTYAGAMSGTGSLIKTGTGTLTLTGANSYTGGTLVSAGRLVGSATSLQGAIVNNAQVEFAQTTVGTYNGVISGSGGFIKTGASVLTLTGANSYTGGTLVLAGRLTGNTTSVQGAIVNNAEVEFAQASTGTYAGNMAGSGAFNKSGIGALTLGGITSITGAADITAGRLNVTGQLAAGGVTVQNTATLSGSGVVGGNVIVQSGGSLAPGESPGTLSVVGNVTFLAGSNFIAEIDGRTYNPAGGAGSHDLLRISGTANLGGIIAPTLRGITGAATNNYVPSIGESFLILSAGTVAGSFSSVAQPAVGLPVGGRFDTIYGGDFVRLVVTPSSFAALGNVQNWNTNSVSAAAGMDNIRLAAGVRSGASQTLFNGLYGMNVGQLETAFSQISGEIYANSLQSVTETERSTFSSIFNASCDVSCGMPGGETTTNRSVWGRYIGKFANHDADRFSSGYNSSSKGLLVGATLTDSNHLQFGVAASYVENEVATSLGASANANSTGGYLYVHFTPSDNFNVSSVLGVSLSGTQVSRSIGTTAGRVSANSEKQSMTVMYGTKASYRGFVNGPLSLWTDVGLELSDTSIGRVQEQAVNSDFALSLDKLSRRSAETQMAARLQLASDDAQISLSAGWVYQLGDDPSVLRNVELGGANWTVRSVDAQRSGIRLGMQSRAQLSKRISLSAMYQHINQGNGYTYNRANVGLNLAF